MKPNLKELTIEITQTCPNSCLHCSSLSSERSAYLIDIKTITNVCAEAKELGIGNICLSGGEPLLHPDLDKIALFITDDLGLRISIYTTGIRKESTFTSNIYWDGFNKERTKLIFGFHSISKQVHNAITRRNFSYDLTLKSIKSAINSNYNVEVHLVPNKINLSTLKETVNALHLMGVRKISFLRLVPQGFASINAQLLELDTKDLEKLASTISEIKDKYGDSLRFGIPFSGILKDRKRCNAGDSKLIIRYDGKILPCEAFKDTRITDYFLGDIYSDKLEVALINGRNLTNLTTLKRYTNIKETCPAQLLYSQRTCRYSEPAETLSAGSNEPLPSLVTVS